MSHIYTFLSLGVDKKKCFFLDHMLYLSSSLDIPIMTIFQYILHAPTYMSYYNVDLSKGASHDNVM